MTKKKKYMWLVYDEEGLERNRDYVSMYEKLCQKYDMEAYAVLANEVRGRIEDGECPDFVLVRTIQPSINEYLESRGVPVYNSSFVSRVCNDKGKTLEYLKDQVLSVPSITISNQELGQFLQKDYAECVKKFVERFRCSIYAKEEQNIIRQAKDYVVKAVDGHGGKQVFSLANEGHRILSEVAGSDVVLQPMILPYQEDGKTISRDLRVYVIGTEIIASVLRSSSMDFRANFSRGGDVKRYELTEKERQIVHQIMERFDFGMVGIDFILDAAGNLILNEIEDVVGARMLYQCAPEIDIASRYLDFVRQNVIEIS